MGAFAYSEEDGTPAAGFPEQVCVPVMHFLCARARSKCVRDCTNAVSCACACDTVCSLTLQGKHTTPVCACRSQTNQDKGGGMS